ncbi:MAG: tripartite tricarboxylate transporter permease [Desulfobacterales bacterium]|nr:tripartite tricarboxylate transporter permease [Desulfobacterales bacterium]
MDLFVTSFIESLKLCGDPLLLLIIFLGVVWGNVGGALPGVGPTLSMGVALPFTFAMTPVQAIAFLVAINVACSYGNSIPAVLIGVPGTSSAVLTAIDGYELHKKGYTGLALGIQYYGAMFGAVVSIIFYFAMVVPLSGMAYIFLPPELFALYLLGCTAVISITSENILKGLVSAAFGLAVTLIEPNPVNAVYRFVFTPDMRWGINVTPVVIGVLAVSELFRQSRQSFNWGVGTTKFKAKFPALKYLWRVTPIVMMGTVIGTIIGAIPGIGGNVACFVSYNQAKLWSKHPEEFGHGSIEGIAANEAAQNASQSGEMVPTFGLGIPGSGSMVILFAAMLMNGIFPGPLLIQQAPHLLYASGAGLIASTVMLILMGWYICRILLWTVSFDRTLVLGTALALTMLGVFTLNRSVFDVFLTVLFGVIGYFMMRYGYSPAGFAIAMILGNGLEGNLRRGVLLCGDWVTFLTRPWTAGILVLTCALLIYGALGTLKLSRQAAALRQQALEGHRASLSG